MNAKLIGFEWKLGAGVNAEDLWLQLRNLRGETVPFGEFSRMIYVAENESTIKGLLLTIKTHKRFAELSKDGEDFRIKVSEIEDGSSLVDFNFFVINKATLRGIYQYYHHSCSVSQFCLFCKRQYDDVCEKIKQDAISKLGPSPKQSAVRKTARFYRGTLKWSIMVRQEALPDLLEEIDSFQRFDFELVSMFANEPTFAPVAKSLRRVVHSLRFKPKVSADYWRAQIPIWVKAFGLKKGRVEGKRSDGTRQMLKLMDTPDSFGEYSIDEILSAEGFNLDDISELSFFAKLLEKMEEHKQIFQE